MEVNEVILNGRTLMSSRNITAVASDVAEGKTFINSAGELDTGTATGGSGGPFEDLVDRTLSSLSASDIENISRIGTNAFSYCEFLLGTVEIPANILEIYEKAFANCYGITSVEIDEGCQSLHNQVFDNCIGLTTIYLPSTINYIHYGVFIGCISLTDIYYNSTQSDWNTLDEFGTLFDSGLTQQITVHCTDGNIVYNQSVGDMVITYRDSTPDRYVPVSATVNSFQDENIQNVRTITLPSGVTTIGADAFQSLNEIYQSGRGAYIVLPSTVTFIGDSAFNCFQGIKDVTCNATVPAVLGYDPFGSGNSYAIKVPSAYLSDYQNDAEWSQYSSRLQGV